MYNNDNRVYIRAGVSMSKAKKKKKKKKKRGEEEKQLSEALPQVQDV